MTKASPAHVDGEAREISYDAFSRVSSETAASSHNRIFGPSGVMDYMVILMNGAVQTPVVVQAATGDEAALKALSGRVGMKVAYVGPATDTPLAIEHIEGQ